MFYTVIQASDDQVAAIYEKHVKSTVRELLSGLLFWRKKTLISKSSIVKYSFSWDDEDSIGFVTLHTITGKRISYQLKRNIPMFVVMIDLNQTSVNFIINRTFSNINVLSCFVFTIIEKTIK